MGSSSSASSWCSWYRQRALWDTGFSLILSFINWVICKGLWIFIHTEKWDRRLEPSNYQQIQLHIQIRPVNQKLLFRSTCMHRLLLLDIVLTGSVMNSAIIMGNTVFFYTSADVSGQNQQELCEIEKLLEKQGDSWAAQMKSFQDRWKKMSVVKKVSKLRHRAFHKPALHMCKPLHKR